jgi:hypothetical protein
MQADGLPPTVRTVVEQALEWRGAAFLEGTAKARDEVVET